MKKAFILAVSLAAVFTACNKEAVPTRVASDEIAFNLGGIFESGVETKATEVTSSNLSSLYVTATTGSTSETAAFSGVSFTKSGSQWKGGQFWPVSDPGYHFYASNVAMTHTVSGQTVSPVNANTDVIVGYLASPGYKQVNTLTMEHVFARVNAVTMKADAGCTVSGLKLSLKPVTSGTFNLKSNDWTSRGTAGSDSYLLGSASSGVNITTAGGTASKTDNDVWLLPGSYTLTCSYTITKGAATKSYTRTASVAFVRGMKNNLVLPGTAKDQPNLKFDDDDISEIAFGVEVTPWGEQDVPVSF